MACIVGGRKENFEEKRQSRVLIISATPRIRDQHEDIQCGGRADCIRLHQVTRQEFCDDLEPDFAQSGCNEGVAVAQSVGDWARKQMVLGSSPGCMVADMRLKSVGRRRDASSYTAIQ